MNLFKLLGTIAIDNSEAEEKINNTTNAAKGLGDSLDGAGTSATNLGNNIDSKSRFGAASVWLGNMLTTLTSKAVSFVSSLAGTGFNYNAQMETYVTSFATMMEGNTEAAEAFVGTIRDLASVTPLGLTGLAGNAQTLMGFGIAAENVVDTLKMLGDVAQGDQNKLDSIVLAYSQITAAGKLNAQDANQLINAGVPIWNMLAEQIGATVGEVRKLSEDGGITAEHVTAALKTATSEGGLYFQAMEKQSKTFNGQMSTLKDNADQATGSFFEPFFEVAKSDVLPKIAEALEKFATWASENTETVTEFATALGNLAVSGIENAISFFQWAVENHEDVVSAFSAITLVVSGLVAKTHPWLAAISSILAYLVEVSTLQNKIDEQMEAMGGERSFAEIMSPNATNGMTGLDFLKIMNGADPTTVKVGVEPESGAAGELQSDLNGMDLSVDVKVNPQMDWLGALAQSFSTNPDAPWLPTWHAEGAIFSKPTLFNTRLGLHGVGEAGPEAVAPIEKLQHYVSDAVNGAIAGLQLNVVLDSGALVGQLAPHMDTQLGTLAGRKGRRN